MFKRMRLVLVHIAMGALLAFGMLTSGGQAAHMPQVHLSDDGDISTPTPTPPPSTNADPGGHGG